MPRTHPPKSDSIASSASKASGMRYVSMLSREIVLGFALPSPSSERAPPFNVIGRVTVAFASKGSFATRDDMQSSTSRVIPLVSIGITHAVRCAGSTPAAKTIFPSVIDGVFFFPAS